MGNPSETQALSPLPISLIPKYLKPVKLPG